MERERHVPVSFLEKARSLVRGRDGFPDAEHDITLSIEWAGPVCRACVNNAGETPVQIREVVLFSDTFPFGTDTRFYGEGFQKLSQYGGTLTHAIQAQGFEPAMWVAPFIAEADSQVFREHPDWFVKDRSGCPLSSDAVSFGGWRRGPWYALDGTHPAVQTHLERVFHTMREAWGCSYFKLDANFWGALHGGCFYDPQATRIEAYRRGMEAVLRGAGDAFVLGCNAPMWASLGLVHGMRVTNDIQRGWQAFRDIAPELFHRNWQNGRLWINDPDCVVLRDRSVGQPLTEQAYTFHATMILASGGMVLSGDDLTDMPGPRMRILRKLVPPTGVAARFADGTFCLGRIDLPDRQMICVFNWTDQPLSISVPLDGRCQITDFWTGRDLGTHERAYELTSLAPHAACLLSCAHKHPIKERQ